MCIRDRSYLVVFIGYLTMYLIRKNFNIAQNDMISTYGLSMTQLGMIGLGFSITYGVGKTLVSYYADGKNTKQFLPFMLILSAICMLGFSASIDVYKRQVLKKPNCIVNLIRKKMVKLKV